MTPLTNASAQPAFERLFGPDPAPESFRPLSTTPASETGFALLAPLAQPVASPGLPPAAATPEELVSQAREQAEAIVAEAQARAALLIQEQVAEAAREVREEQTEAFATAARELLTALREQWEAHLRYLEREAAGLVVAIARRVLHERFTADEAAIVPVVREALRPLADEKHVRVIVSPRHQAALQDAFGELARVLKENSHLEIVLTEAAEPFGCLVHGESSSVDARLENRLAALQEAAQEALLSDSAA